MKMSLKESPMAISFFESVLRGCDDAIITKSLDGVVTSWNPAAERIFGYTEAEMVGQSLLVLFPKDRLNEERFIIEKVMLGELVDHFETVRLRKDGLPIHVSVTISPIRDEFGQVVGASKIARDITEHMQLLEHLRYFKALVDSTSDAVISKTTEGIVTSWNAAAERLFGYRPEEMLGQPLLRLIPPDRGHEEDEILAKIRAGQRIQHFETVRQTKAGQLVPVSVCISPIHDAQGQVQGASKIVRDISTQKALEARLRLTASVFTHANEGIAITDPQGQLVDVNQAFSDITGYARDEVLGKTPLFFRSGRDGPEVFVPLLRDLRAQGRCQGEIWSRRKNGEAYAGLLTVSQVCDAQGQVQNYVALFADVTSIRVQQERLEHIAHFDALTNLPNRLLLSDRLRQAMVQCRRSQQSLAVVYLDLDGFKAINDRHGHDVGDAYLIAVAQQMKQALRECDTLARMGGDEFVAVLSDVSSAEACGQLVERILHACATPLPVAGLCLQASASIGVTLFPQDDVDADQLLRHADQAMYEAKQSGKNRLHIFDPVQDAELKSRAGSLAELRQALNAGEFELYYQPKVHMREGRVVGAEALIRWNHPERGLLLPAAFLPLINGHLLEELLGDWVLEQGLRQASTWQRQGLDLQLSINIGARQIQRPGFTAHLAACLASYPNVPPGRIELEVLESNALDDIEQVSRIMRECHQMGLRFAVDDFGTGYSSLTYLRRLPAETLKIDQSFVRDMLDDAEDLAIVQGVIGLAQAFRREVVAEGVETQAQGTQLLAMGCELAQGHAIARPMRADELMAWCAQWRPCEAWLRA
ncbi:EAL domain-containing protein [Curvibacter sp. HBC61]|uniref:EAL domain-containing protein n=1 Tax=Curvibacter cyanobacteriorum TaxID=3026422 RepID=A0ABT5N2K2_9BURK|nr:EAL domain-containing protein [Curvibacter sp. HBC61]MDD0839814.1 EAL domain-containing protein [Curvibacter sp. HBC61]